MRCEGKSILIAVVILSVGIFSSAGTVFAGALGASWTPDPTGHPGNGLHLSTNAPGTKLYGTMEISYTPVIQNTCDHLSSVLRVRMGNDLMTFWSGDLTPSPALDVSQDVVVQDYLTQIFAPMIVKELFDDAPSCVRLKNATELSATPNVCVTSDCLVFNKYVVLDVEIAVASGDCPE